MIRLRMKNYSMILIKKLVDQRPEEITNLDKKVNSDDLTYRYKGNNADAKFNEFDNAFSLLNKIKDDKIGLADGKDDQAKFKSNLSEKHRSKEYKNAMYNIEMFYKASNSFIEFFDDYSSMVLEAKLKATKGIGIKILTPKQMLQRLLIALAKVKAGNNSENLLNEIRQIVYSLYQSKEFAKKVYNYITISIQLDTIFIDSKNSKTSEPHVLILKLSDNLDLRRGEKNVAL